VITNPTLTPSEFLELALLDFGLSEIPASKAQRLWKLQKLILEGQRSGKVSALVVDEAHKLSPDVLEEIRLLGNFEDADQKLLQILLVGQPELDELLNRHDLRQFKQRIGVRLAIGPLATAEVGQYIRHRWSVAGGASPPFSPESIVQIAQASQSIPRVINSVCDNALLLAFAEGEKQVDTRHVLEAAADLQLVIAQRLGSVSTMSPIPSEDQSPRETAKASVDGRNGSSPAGSLWPTWKGRFQNTGPDEVS
jgi:general secretion pathway protein A